MDVTEIKAYKCGICGAAFTTKKVAEKCCMPKYCEKCGVELPKNWYYIACDNCLTERQYENAEKIKAKDWNGYIYKEGYGYNEGYFPSIDELEEYCQDEEIEIPGWVFACTQVKNELNIEIALENMLDDCYEGAKDHIIDMNELLDFIDKWNAKQNIITYEPNYKTIILLKEAQHKESL